MHSYHDLIYKAYIGGRNAATILEGKNAATMIRVQSYPIFHTRLADYNAHLPGFISNAMISKTCRTKQEKMDRTARYIAVLNRCKMFMLATMLFQGNYQIH